LYIAEYIKLEFNIDGVIELEFNFDDVSKHGGLGGVYRLLLVFKTFVNTFFEKLNYIVTVSFNDMFYSWKFKSSVEN